MTTAQDLSAFLSTVKEKVDSYNAERQQLAESLRQIVGQAQQLLSELGEPIVVSTGAASGAPARRGRPPGSGRKRGRPAGSKNAAGAQKGARKGRPGRRKGAKMSAEAREKIAAAQRARWAKQKGSSD